MNKTLFSENLDTFHCEIDNAYGAIVCVRVAADISTNEDFSCFAAELYCIEYYLKLLVGILDQQTSEFNKPIDELNIQRFYKHLKRTIELFNENVIETPVNENTIFLHKKGIGAAFAAYGIVKNMIVEFEEIMGVTE